MTPSPSPIVAQFQATLQQASVQLQQTLAQAAEGCRQTIALSPTDPTALTNALLAIDLQVREMTVQVSQTMAALAGQRPGDPGGAMLSSLMPPFEHWKTETWHRFEVQWQVEQYRAMWPQVQQAMQKPAACVRCGAPLRRTTPHQNEAIACEACRSVNQVTPDPAVANYFGGMPHWYAEMAAMEHRFAHDRVQMEWESYQLAQRAAGRDSPPEPLAQLERRRAMQLDYWRAYASAKTQYEGRAPADAESLVDARMRE